MNISVHTNTFNITARHLFPPFFHSSSISSLLFPLSSPFILTVILKTLLCTSRYNKLYYLFLFSPKGVTLFSHRSPNRETLLHVSSYRDIDSERSFSKPRRRRPPSLCSISLAAGPCHFVAEKKRDGVAITQPLAVANSTFRVRASFGTSTMTTMCTKRATWRKTTVLLRWFW